MNIKATSVLAVLALAACDSGSGDTTTTSTGSGGTESSTVGTGGMGGAGGVPTLETFIAYAAPDMHKFAGVHVFATDADGHVTTEAETNANGTAQFNVPEGGAVTVALQFDGVDSGGQPTHLRRLYTYFGVPDGGTIGFHSNDPAAVLPMPNTPMTKISFTFPTIPLGTASLSMTPSCHPPVNVPVGPVTTVLDLADYAGCAGKPTYDVVVLALAADGITILGSALAAAQPFMPAQSVTSQLTFSAAPLAPFDISVVGIPVDMKLPEIKMRGFRDTLLLNTQVFLADPPLAPTAMVQAHLPSDAFEAWSLIAQGFVGPNVSVSEVQNFLQPMLPASFSLDLSKIAVPVITQPDFTDTQHPVLPWKLVGAPLQDAVALQVGWVNGNDTTIWNVVSPPVADGSARLPDMSTKTAGWTFQPGSAFTDFSTTLLDRKDVSTYQEYIDPPNGKFSSVGSSCDVLP